MAGKLRTTSCTNIKSRLTDIKIGFGNIGGIIAVWIFLAKDKPYYTAGFSTCLSFYFLSILSCVAYFVACWVQNRTKDRAVTDPSLTEYEKTGLGNLSLDYRYLL